MFEKEIEPFILIPSMESIDFPRFYISPKGTNQTLNLKNAYNLLLHFQLSWLRSMKSGVFNHLQSGALSLDSNKFTIWDL